MDVSVDHVWSQKDEPSRANNWRGEEIVALLNAIKSHNLTKGCPSSNQLGQLLEPLLGYGRTAFQISGKLKNLRKSYLICEKKGCTPAALKECPYYYLLAEVYANEGNRDSEDTGNASGNLAEDVKVSSERGIETMLRVIRELNLGADLSPPSFSPGAVRLISKMLIARGICATGEQVKSTLTELRRGYIEFRQNRERKDNRELANLPHLEYLDALWNCSTAVSTDVPRDANVTLARTKTETKDLLGDYWSEKETIALLMSIKALELTDEASRNTEESARRLKDALNDSGYARSEYQIQRRLDNLQNSYLNAQQAKSLVEAIRQFPFYALYGSIFNVGDLCIPDFCTSDTIDELNAREQQQQQQQQQDEYEEEQEESMKAKHSRSRSWSDDETTLMLNLLKDLNLARLIAHRLSVEKTAKLVEPMRERGFTRTAMQIQIKLRNLRKSYYRCIRAGSTENAIAECPFYDKLNAIFRQPKDRKLQTVRKLEPVDSSFVSATESFTDHSYSNATGKIEKMVKTPKAERNDSDDDSSSEVWLPVETICDESVDDSTSVHREEEASGFKEAQTMKAETEALRARSNAEDVATEFGDPVVQLPEIGNDTGQKNSAENNARKSHLESGHSSTYENCKSESPGPSRKSSDRLDRSKRHAAKSLKTSKDSATLRSMRNVVAEMLRHEKMLQRQHHVWMERQFEIQRQHDREQRELLLRELREFRKAVASAAKDQLPESPK